MTRWSPDEGRAAEGWPGALGVLSVNWDWRDLGSQAGRTGTTDTVGSMSREEEHEQALEEAYQKGRRDGEAAGLEQALRELNPSRMAAETAASQLNVLREELTSRTEENLMALALAVARKVLEREIETGPGTVAELVAKALSHFPLNQKIKVRLNPADLAFLADVGDNGPDVDTAGREVRWIPDESVSRGGCLVEGPEHVVDGRLDTALERIFRTVFND